jgi:hypothetical protein
MTNAAYIATASVSNAGGKLTKICTAKFWLLKFGVALFVKTSSCAARKYKSNKFVKFIVKILSIARRKISQAR